MPVHRVAARISLIAWIGAGAALAWASVLWEAGCRPHDIPLLFMPDSMVFDHIARSVFHAVLGVLLFSWVAFFGTRVLFSACGRPWRHRTEASRSIPSSSLQAEEIVGQALERLMALGYRMGPREPVGTEGWRTTASRRERVSEDPRRIRQSLEFRYSGGTLELVHRYGKKKWDREERGEREYQAWLLDSIARGTDLDRPPLRLDLALLLPLPSLAFAAFGAWLQGAPEQTRREWFGAVSAGSLLLAFLLVFFPAISAVSRSWTIGRKAYLPSLLLVLAGLFFANSGKHSWELDQWRSSKDPETLVDAGISAWRDSQGSSLCSPLSRAGQALRARVEIELRLSRLGDQAVPFLLGHSTRPREWIDSVNDWCWQMICRKVARDGSPLCANYLFLLREPDSFVWRRAVLQDMAPCEFKSLSEASLHPDPRVRFSALLVQEGWSNTAEAKHTFINALRDPEEGVRTLAIRGLSYMGHNHPDPEIETALVPLWEDPCPEVRADALRAHRFHRSGVTTPALLEFIPRAGPLRGKALRALAHSTDSAALPTLLDSMMDPDAGYTIRQELGSFGPSVLGPLLDRLDRLDDSTLLPILRSVRIRNARLHTTPLERLLVLADDPRKERSQAALALLARASNPEARARALRALEGPDAFLVIGPLLDSGALHRDALLGLLDRQSDRMLSEFLSRPWWFEDPDVGRWLKTRLIGETSGSWNSTWALIHLSERCPQDVDEVARAWVKQGRSRNLPEYAYRCLGTDLLLQLLQDPGAQVRDVFAALGERHESRVVDALMDELRTRGDRAGQSALALARLRGSEALPLLLDIAEQPECRNPALVLALGIPQARPALRRIRDRAQREDDPKLFGAAVIALARAGEPGVVEDLRAILRHRASFASTPRISLEEPAAEALAGMGEAGVSQLLEALAETAPDPVPILRALGLCDSEEAGVVLRTYLDSGRPTECATAAVALARRGDPADIPRVLKAAMDPSNYKVEDTAWALGRLTGHDFGARAPNTENLSASEHVTDRIRAAVRAWSTERSD